MELLIDENSLTMNILTKRHKVRIVLHGFTNTAAFFPEDEGEEVSKEPAPFRELIQNANFVSLENRKIERLQKFGKKDGEVFEMTIKYLVE